MSTHLPIRILRPLHRQCASQCTNIRPFSTTLVRPGRSKTSQKARRFQDPIWIAASSRLQGGKAPVVTYHNQLEEESNVPDDIGMLPGTFIRKPLFPHRASVLSRLMQFQLDPSRESHKSWLKKLQARAVYDLQFLWSQVKSWILIVQFKWMLKNCPPLYFVRKRQWVKNIAKERYIHLYKSFAAGDIKAINEMCTSGVAEGFRNRIAARPPGVTAEWTLKDRYKVSLISNHPVMISLPGYEDTGVQQIVFRIQTTQNLTYRSTSKGSKYEGLGFDSRGAPVTDYFVLQRRVVRGKFQDWKVWGFANEWDMETIKEDAQHRRELEAYEGSSDM